MREIVEILVPAFAFLIVICVPFGFAAFTRYLRYKETLALAEQGLLRPEKKRNSHDSLRWGIIIATLSLGVSCGLFPIGFAIDPVTAQNMFGFGPWMLIGLIPLFFGCALIISHYATRFAYKSDDSLDDKGDDPIPSHKQ